ncbi:MAG: hypothetical protein R6U44_10225 [Archaeoglobaceae archaeon]
MNINAISPDEIRIAGLKALEKELGPVGMVRFLQQYELGEGDYTKERKKLLEKYPEVDKIIEEIEKMRKDG